ncbi:hypothetical protein [Alicyclobacillus shizuokensis]|uniref:hypothetical protein n=1 Tax=Alicyclobacillus shizuokensis TaxID=392014 RepID=UPI00083488BA|nr:hypothetical protein [Alicyclobacillus shizuokensis]
MATKRGSARLDQSLAALKELASQLGYWPSKEQWDEYASVHGLLRYMSMYYHIRKSWNTLRDEMGFSPREVTYTKEDCIRALQEAAKVAPLLSQDAYEAWQTQHPEYPTLEQVKRRLGGTWNRAKERAGLPTVDPAREGWSDEELRASLLACSAFYGLKFSEQDYVEWREKHPDRPHIETIRARFGGMAQAKKALGLDAYEVGPPTEYTDAQILSYLLRFLREQISLDAYLQWREVNGGPSMTPIRERFGGYEEALRRSLELYLWKGRN